jgi:hypothetical protein
LHEYPTKAKGYVAKNGTTQTSVLSRNHLPLSEYATGRSHNVPPEVALRVSRSPKPRHSPFITKSLLQCEQKLISKYWNGSLIEVIGTHLAETFFLPVFHSEF